LNAVYLYNDNLSVLQGPLTPGSVGSLKNGQCEISGSATALVSSSGTDLVLQLGIGLTGSFATAPKGIYLWVVDAGATGTGWIQTGTWTPGASGPQPPAVVSGTPVNPVGSPQTLTLTGRDANGATDISRVYFLLNGTATIPANVCHGFYDRTVNGVFLYNDALSVLQGPLTPGSGGAIRNSQCEISGSTTALVSSSGTDLVLQLGMKLQGPFATGTQKVYLWVVDAGGNGTGWVQTGTWTMP
jgi:hypothetical protein